MLQFACLKIGVFWDDSFRFSAAEAGTYLGYVNTNLYIVILYII